MIKIIKIQKKKDKKEMKKKNNGKYENLEFGI